jgi:hypothetical protein
MDGAGVGVAAGVDGAGVDVAAGVDGTGSAVAVAVAAEGANGTDPVGDKETDRAQAASARAVTTTNRSFLALDMIVAG